MGASAKIAVSEGSVRVYLVELENSLTLRNSKNPRVSAAFTISLS